MSKFSPHTFPKSPICPERVAYTTCAVEERRTSILTSYYLIILSSFFFYLLSPLMTFSQTIYCDDESQYARWLDNCNQLQQKNPDIRIQGFTAIIEQVYACLNYLQNKKLLIDSYKFKLKVFLSETYTHRGKAYREKEEINQACKDFKTAMDLNLGNMYARQNYRTLCTTSAHFHKQKVKDVKNKKTLSVSDTSDKSDTSMKTEDANEPTDIINPLQLTQNIPKNNSKIRLTNSPPTTTKSDLPVQKSVMNIQAKDLSIQQKYAKYSTETEIGRWSWLDFIFFILGISFIGGVAIIIYLAVKSWREKKEKIPQSKLVEIAKKLSEAGKHEEAIKSLRDSVIISAIGDKKTSDVLDIFEKANKLKEFVTIRSKNKTNEFYTAYGRELIQRKKYRELLELYKHNKATRLNIEDMDNIFQANLYLGDFERARDTIKIMLEQKTGEKIPFERSLELYYNFAQLCEEKNENQLAFRIYQLFIDGKIIYKDITNRHARLEKIVKKPTEIKLLDGKYEILLPIGIGGMGEVYEGWDHKLERKVAIKKMRSELKNHPEERTRFLHEARTVAKLEHPYIVGIHAVVEEPNDIYIVFDYVRGKTLSEILKERKYLSLDECRTYFSHICPALQYAHQKGIIHKDIKLSNIMVDINGFAKLMDFGLASEIIRIELKEGQTTNTNKFVGQKESCAAGTLPYMAPEQHMGIIHPQCDIYAMGVCLYEMLTGKLPFIAREPSEILRLKYEKKFQYPSALRPGIPISIDRLLFRVFEPEPQNRPQNAMEFLSLLKK